jgi:GntR family transcriptional regulator
MPAAEIDFSRFTLRDDLPPHRQVAAYFKVLIALGQLAPGTDVPGAPVLAPRLGVRAGEAKRAYAELQDQGYLVLREGAWKVADDRGPIAAAGEVEQLRVRLEELIQEGREAGLSRAALLHLFTSLLAR